MVGGLFLVLVAIIIAAAVFWLIKKRRKITERSTRINQKEQVEEKNFKSLSSLHHQIDDDHDWEKRHKSSSLQITTEDNVAYVQAIPTEENIAYGQTTGNIPTEENIAYGQTTTNIPTEENIAYRGATNHFTAEDNVYYTVK